MLFFVKGEIIGVVPLPVEQMLELAVKHWKASGSYQEQGKVLAGGAMAGRKGGCAIFDVESAEELHTLIHQLPMFPFCEWEVIPLVPAGYAQDLATQALAAMKGQSK